MSDVGKFQVMAMMQAVRYKILKPYCLEEEAFSWGGNRAIFYAYCKYRKGVGKKPSSRSKSRVVKIDGHLKSKKIDMEGVGDEKGYCIRFADKVLYVMGSLVIDEKWWVKSVINRFDSYDHYFQCMKIIENHVEQFPVEILSSRRSFFKVVYEPVREAFAEQFNLMGAGYSHQEAVEIQKSVERAIRKSKKRKIVNS